MGTLIALLLGALGIQLAGPFVGMFMLVALTILGLPAFLTDLLLKFFFGGTDKGIRGGISVIVGSIVPTLVVYGYNRSIEDILGATVLLIPIWFIPAVMGQNVAALLLHEN